jgi:hypothetical protein
MLGHGSWRGIVLWVAPGSDATAVAAGFAELFAEGARLVELSGDYLRVGEAPALLEPLLSGQTLVLASPGGGELAPRFADRWLYWLDYPRGTSVSVVRNLTLEPMVLEDPGTLITVVLTPRQRPDIDRPVEFSLDATEATELQRAARRSPDLVVGAGQRDAEITIRELCLLHGRDPLGTPREPLGVVLEDRSDPITWTDLEELLAHGRSNHSLLDDLQRQDRIDDEKWTFGLAAFDFLDERATRVPVGGEVAVYDSIWDVVWSHPWLDRDDRYIFRGQVNSRWSLTPKIFRPPGEESPLDVGTLVERIELTDAFVQALQRNAPDLLDGDPSEEELLAIAQHYGFWTPLLDFTRSFAIGAFFATVRPSGTWDDAIGVIHYMSSTRSEFAAEEGLVDRLRIGTFSVLDAARLRFGDLHVVEPQLRDVDNRIGRQRGLFVAGYEVRDLQQVSIDRLRFRQHPGEVFEDPSRGVVAAMLLQPDSPIQSLADEVCARARGRRRMLNAGLASARLMAYPLIGSDGAQLFAQVRAAADFFDELRELVPPKTVDALATIFDDYFRAARARADVAEALNSQAPKAEAPTPPIVTAIDELAALTGTHADRLWAAVFHELKPGPADDFLDEPRVSPLEVESADDRLAFASALFLAAWEHLQFVGGTAARRLLESARSALGGGVPYP